MQEYFLPAWTSSSSYLSWLSKKLNNSLNRRLRSSTLLTIDDTSSKLPTEIQRQIKGVEKTSRYGQSRVFKKVKVSRHFVHERGGLRIGRRRVLIVSSRCSHDHSSNKQRKEQLSIKEITRSREHAGWINTLVHTSETVARRANSRVTHDDINSGATTTRFLPLFVGHQRAGMMIECRSKSEDSISLNDTNSTVVRHATNVGCSYNDSREFHFQQTFTGWRRKENKRKWTSTNWT